MPAGLSVPDRAMLAPAPRPALQDWMQRPGAREGLQVFRAPRP